ncbi:MAG: efflux transporter outer membrane subunit, partial [Acidobacteria bacterium]|nr:efflux transporter outer membrane subunit [Acidobacteriota bacterium]
GVAVPDAWPPAESPAEEVTTGGALEGGEEQGLSPDWWTAFGDPTLDQVVQQALEQNRDLVAAASRLEQAAADSRIAGSGLLPTVQASFNGSRRRQNFIGFPIPGSDGRVLSTVSANMGVSLDTTWEADLWGRLRAGARASLADLQATAADYRGAQLSIAGQTVKAWLAAVEARQQISLAEATVASFRASSEQVRSRFEAGLRSSLDVRLSLSSLASAEALLQQRRQQLDATQRQLGVLLGQYAGMNLGIATELPDVPAAVPAGLPADLVRRRPDLVAAERRLAAVNERLVVAERDLYPRISLTGSTGTASGALKSLFDPAFSVWSLAGSLLQPIFQGGRLRAGVDRAEARVDESLATYAAAALQAYAEVEAALAAEAFFQERLGYLSVSSEQSRSAEALAEARYRSGLENFVTVLEAQRLALQADGELIAARRLLLENRVDLYLALGGGFHELEAPVLLQTADDPLALSSESP